MNNNTTQQQIKLDTILNKTVLDLGVYSCLGYGVGFVVGALFKKTHVMKNFAGGIGGSYGFVLNKDSFNHALWFIHHNTKSHPYLSYLYIYIYVSTTTTHLLPSRMQLPTHLLHQPVRSHWWITKSISSYPEHNSKLTKYLSKYTNQPY